MSRPTRIIHGEPQPWYDRMPRICRLVEIPAGMYAPGYREMPVNAGTLRAVNYAFVPVGPFEDEGEAA